MRGGIGNRTRCLAATDGPGGLLGQVALDGDALRHALHNRMLAVDLRVDRVVAGIDVERGVGCVTVLVGQARVVVDEGVATIDADDAEGPTGVLAAALRIADVVAGRSRGVGEGAHLVSQEDRGGGQHRGDREQATKPAVHGLHHCGGKLSFSQPGAPCRDVTA